MARPLDAASLSPVTVIDGEALAASSATSLDQLLNKLPAFGSQGVNGVQTDGGYGAAFVDLRNLNFNRTLVLVNGRRFVLSGIKTDEAVDMNNIPLAMVDHVEILRDGSEPIFGADAIAGAVNIVLKKDFDGVTASALGGISGRGDGATDTVSATFGHNFGANANNGNITFSARPVAQQPDPPVGPILGARSHHFRGNRRRRLAPTDPGGIGHSGRACPIRQWDRCPGPGWRALPRLQRGHRQL